MDLKDTEVIEAESKSIDVKQYAGKRVLIEGVEDFDSEFKEDGKVSFRVFTEPVDVIDKSDGGTIEIRGSVIMNLQTTDEGQLAAYPGSRAHTFMKHYNISKLSELIGKTCRVEPGPKGYLSIEVA